MTESHNTGAAFVVFFTCFALFVAPWATPIVLLLDFLMFSAIAALWAGAMGRRRWIWFLASLFLTPFVAYIVIFFFPVGQPRHSTYAVSSINTKKKRRIVLWIGIGMAAIALMFPPLLGEGHVFLLFSHGGIRFPKLALELLAIAILTASVLYTMEKTDRK